MGHSLTFFVNISDFNGRKLKFVLELLLVMMHLSLGLLVHDLACLFQISDSIFITWIKLMRLELSHLIVWPGKHVIKENRPRLKF
jgi:hypothetical protein